MLQHGVNGPFCGVLKLEVKMQKKLPVISVIIIIRSAL